MSEKIEEVAEKFYLKYLVLKTKKEINIDRLIADLSHFEGNRSTTKWGDIMQILLDCETKEKVIKD